MKKLLTLLLIIVLTTNIHAQNNVYNIVPKAILPGDSARAIQVSAITNNFDSSTIIGVVIYIDNRTETPDKLQRRYKYPVTAFAHYPALKSEILARIENELKILILTK